VRLKVIHKTSYAYAEAVSTSHHLAHLAPRGGEGRHMFSHDVLITPHPSVTRERLDFFGNRTLYFSVREPHRSLDVVATSVVDIAPLRPPRLEASPPWNEIRDRLRSDRRRDLLDAFSFTFDSPYARPSAELRAYAAESFPEGRPLLTGVRDLTHRIYEDFEYDPTSTDVTTGVDVVMRQRRGVCQDFAHLQIGCLRSLGLPVRYVSGYLVTHPPPGRPRLVGADACGQHALARLRQGSARRRRGVDGASGIAEGAGQPGLRAPRGRPGAHVYPDRQRQADRA
jgi:transglutaminase-like putative cysteine protease